MALGNREEDCKPYRRRDLGAHLPESPWAMPYESGRWVWICREPTIPVSQLWPRHGHYG